MTAAALIFRRSGHLARQAARSVVLPRLARPPAQPVRRLQNIRRLTSSAFRMKPDGNQTVTSPMTEAEEIPGSVRPTSNATVLTQAEYDKLSDETMETLHERLEEVVDEYSPEGNFAWEVEYSSGVLTLSLGPHGTYVINKQPPNKEIWLSSPFSGPARFSYSRPDVTSSSTGGSWFYPRDNVALGELLDREIRSVLEAEVGKGDAASWVGPGVN